MNNEKYATEIAILLKFQMGNQLSQEEQDRLDFIMRTDSHFSEIASTIISEDYVSQIEQYKKYNIQARISSGLYRKIEVIRRARRKRIAIILSSVAAVIAIIITTVFNFIEKGDNHSSDHKSIIAVTTELPSSSDIVMLVTEKGKWLKLEGAIYNTIQDTVLNAVPDTTLSTIIVPARKEFTIVLSDGTKVWLNSSSRLSFPKKFSDGERIVEIDGEGYFDVTHDPQRPFIVKNSVMNTRVLGTKFMVSAYSNNTTHCVSLVEGEVEVSANNMNYSQILSPGQGVKYTMESATFQTDDIDIAAIEAKRQGLFVFENTKLSDICNDLTRQYGVTFHFTSEPLKNRIFYIITKKYDSIETVLELIHVAGDINYKIDNNTIVLF